MELAGAALLQLALDAPLNLALVVGIVLALIRWREAAAYRLVLVALVLLLLTGIAGTLLNTLLPITLARDYAMSAAQMGATLGVIHIVFVVLDTAAWALLLVALFNRRLWAGPGLRTVGRAG